MSERKCHFAAKRSFKDGCVKLRYEGDAGGYGAAITVKLSDDIRTGDASPTCGGIDPASGRG